MTQAEDLQGFRRVQQLAYAATEAVASRLTLGLTERDVAEMLSAWLREAGVRHWFHIPFAWFGTRTALAHDGSPEAFAPSNEKLVEGMPVILDVAPIVDGYAADVAHALSFGENPRMARMLDDLLVYRATILSEVRERLPRQDIYRRLDARMRKDGYDNRHRVYPMEVLGHRVARLEPTSGDVTLETSFGPSALAMFKSLSKQSHTTPELSPFWNSRPCGSTDVALSPGLWAVEPHVGDATMGAKFEEILVVTEDDAYWLDDDVPHMRRTLRAA